jgi:hypothetical protein
VTDYDDPEPDEPLDGEGDGDGDDSSDWDDGVDPELRFWVRLANEAQSDGFVHVVLTLAGQVVSGEIIGFHQWELGQLDQLEESGVPAEDVELVRRAAADREALGAVEDILSGKPRQPRFIHLRNVVVFNGPAQLHSQIWRGRLDAVDGWTLGSRSTQ